MKEHKPQGSTQVRVVETSVDISTFQRQLGSIVSSSIPGLALVVPVVKAILSMPRGDDNGVFMGQALQDNFSFVLGYIISTLISDHPGYSESYPFKI